MIIPVILCGGAGTRLWPLSRKSFPKQFVPIVGGKSLLQLTAERVAPLGPQLMLVAAEPHRFLVAEALQSVDSPTQIILEPAGRNTAAAMALAALQADHMGLEDALLLFCPADHHIPDAEAFRDCIDGGVPAAQAGAIVTFGIAPTFPSTAYGYIQAGEKLEAQSHARKAVRFIEKPDAARAQDLLLQGDYLWNAGIFLCRADTLIAAMELHAPDILATCKSALPQSAPAEQLPQSQKDLYWVRPSAASFGACRSQSFDYAVMEHHAKVAVVPFQGGWSDVGSWTAVADLAPADARGNRVEGMGYTIEADNTFVHAPNRPVVALGTRDLLIIDTPDALLVTDRDHAEAVKTAVSMLEGQGCTQAVTHRKVARPWGWYDSIDMGERFQVKRIGVKPGASLSLQKHHHRAEHWIVVKGTAEVQCGDDKFLLTENESTYIPIGAVHRLHNPGKLELEMIEVQSGAYLGEDDIVRLEDTYGRTESSKT